MQYIVYYYASLYFIFFEWPLSQLSSDGNDDYDNKNVHNVIDIITKTFTYFSVHKVTSECLQKTIHVNYYNHYSYSNHKSTVNVSTPSTPTLTLSLSSPSPSPPLSLSPSPSPLLSYNYHLYLIFFIFIRIVLNHHRYKQHYY